jgi:hypothetical protein
MAKAEGKSKYQILQKWKTKYHSKKITETECKYQIAETEKKMKYQKQLQRQNINTKLQKLKESRNTRFCKSER